MSKEGLKRFLDTAKREPQLKADFAAAVSDFARQAGFAVDATDVAALIDRTPRTRSGMDGYYEDRAHDHDDMYGGATTQAMGEEEPRTRPEEPVATTMALGEEDKKPEPRVTTQALGEEDDKGRPSVTMAIGEEDKRKTPPSGGPRVTTLAMGEEGRKPRTPQP
jgi:hypothetical protein